MYWNPRRVVTSAKVFCKVDLCWNSVHSCLSCGTSLSPTGAWVNWLAEVAVSSSASLAVAGISWLLGRPHRHRLVARHRDMKEGKLRAECGNRPGRANRGELWLNNMFDLLVLKGNLLWIMHVGKMKQNSFRNHDNFPLLAFSQNKYRDILKWIVFAMLVTVYFKRIWLLGKRREQMFMCKNCNIRLFKFEQHTSSIISLFVCSGKLFPSLLGSIYNYPKAKDFTATKFRFASKVSTISFCVALSFSFRGLVKDTQETTKDL